MLLAAKCLVDGRGSPKGVSQEASGQASGAEDDHFDWSLSIPSWKSSNCFSCFCRSFVLFMLFRTASRPFRIFEPASTVLASPFLAATAFLSCSRIDPSFVRISLTRCFILLLTTYTRRLSLWTPLEWCTSSSGTAICGSSHRSCENSDVVFVEFKSF